MRCAATSLEWMHQVLASSPAPALAPSPSCRLDAHSSFSCIHDTYRTELISPPFTSCGISFGEYYCEVCRMWDAKVSADLDGKFHCEGCGICRVGKREDYVHCDKCAMCQPVSAEGHLCQLDQAYKADCPVCQLDLFGSRISATQLRCGHPIHTTCFDELRRRDYR